MTAIIVVPWAVVVVAPAAAEEAADGGVEAQSTNEGGEEDDYDHGGVGLELFGARVGPPAAGVRNACRLSGGGRGGERRREVDEAKFSYLGCC